MLIIHTMLVKRYSKHVGAELNEQEKNNIYINIVVEQFLPDYRDTYTRHTTHHTADTRPHIPKQTSVKETEQAEVCTRTRTVYTQQ